MYRIGLTGLEVRSRNELQTGLGKDFREVDKSQVSGGLREDIKAASSACCWEIVDIVPNFGKVRITQHATIQLDTWSKSVCVQRTYVYRTHSFLVVLLEWTKVGLQVSQKLLERQDEQHEFVGENIMHLHHQRYMAFH